MDKTKESLAEFWSIVLDIWEQGVYGIDIGSILSAIGILIVALLFRGLFTKFVVRRIDNWVASSNGKVDDKIIRAIIPPIRFTPIILGLFFAFKALPLPEATTPFTDKIIRTLIIFTMFWSLSRLMEPLRTMFRKLEKLFSKSMVQWISKLLKVLIIVIGAATILETWGIKIAPILAGLGLFGVAVALGAQDFFKNLIAGITIIAEKRFNPGDWIKVDGVVEGTVEDVGFRSTAIRRFDKAPVHVPNAQLSDAAVTNFSRMTHRRIYWTIGIEYSASTPQLKIIRDEIMAHLEKSGSFDMNVSTFVRIDSFGASSIDIMLYCFTKTTNWGEWLQIKEDLAFVIKDIVENKAGTGFAFPSQSVYIESLPNDRPESFVPPTAS